MIRNKKIKKNCLFSFSCLFAAVLLTFSCASASGAKTEGENETVTEAPEISADDNAIVKSEEQVVETAPETVETASEVEVEPAEETVETAADKKTKTKAKKSKKSDKKNYTGWIDSSGRPIDATFGSIRIKVRPKTGTFNILTVNENNKSLPVLTTANEYTTSSFYLLSGKKIIKLNEDVNVKTSARKTADGVQLKYVVEKNAEVIIDFKTFKATEKGDIDTLKITGTVKNLGKKKKELALKVILDTILGETDRHHFYDSNNVPVKSEISLRNVKDAKWFLSKNENAAMQIILSGKDCTVPALAALANYATLDTTSWEPDMLSYRTFDTVLSYNNSAVGIVWQTRNLGPEEESKDICYLSFGTDGDMPLGSGWIEQSDSLDELEKTDEPIKAADKQDEVKVEEVALPVEKIPAVQTENEKDKKNQSVNENTENSNQKLNKEDKNSAQKIDAYTPETSDTNKKVSNDYIQQLLNRIAALEYSDESVDKEELMKLNEELDSILEMLRN